MGRLTRADGKVVDRSSSQSKVLQQVGWLGHTGQVYPMGAGPSSGQEPGGFTALFICVGTWEYLGGGKWGIRD